MGMRFRKSIKLGGGVRLNLSKSGIGYSVGTKGARITKTANGRTRKTVGIPGTGISYTSESGSKKKAAAATPIIETTKKPSKALGVIYRILALPLIVLGLLLALAVNAVGWAFVAFGLLLWITGGRAIKKSK